jgi:pimeloyl-ACP methyl ester carboxylesterase
LRVEYQKMPCWRRKVKQNGIAYTERQARGGRCGHPALPDPAKAHGMDSPRTLTGSDGITLHYRLQRGAGSQRVAVLLHGAASNLTRWSELVHDSTLADDGWDLLRPDLRGHARSVTRTPFDLDCWADDLAAILNAECYSEAVLIGHCLGANLALHFAHRHPQRTQGLVLIEPMLAPALAGVLRRACRIAPLLRLLTAATRRLNRLGLYRRKLMALDLHALDRETRSRMAAEGSASAMLNRYASPAFDLRHTPTATFLQDIVEVCRQPPLHEITAPVLALLSSGKHFSDPVVTWRELSALPNIRIRSLPSHHWIPTEQPLAMREAIEAWCRQLLAEAGERAR